MLPWWHAMTVLNYPQRVIKCCMDPISSLWRAGTAIEMVYPPQLPPFVGSRPVSLIWTGQNALGRRDILGSKYETSDPCENMRYSSHGLRSWSVLDVAIYCLIIWYDKYLGMISILVGVIMTRTPSWWSHQESILTVHIYLHNISRNKLIKSIDKQTQTSIKHIFYLLLLLQSTNYFLL